MMLQAQRLRIGSVALVVLALLLSTPADAALTKDQQKCIRVQNSNLRKVAAAVGRQVKLCVRNIARGSESRSLSDCVMDDDAGKIAQAEQRTADDDVRVCQGLDKNGQPRAPAVFYTGPATVNASARALGEVLIPVVFGPSETVFLNQAERYGAPCQQRVVKALQRCQDTRLKSFEKCKRRALEVGQLPSPSGASTAAELEVCLADDPTGKVARICEDAALRHLERGCRDNTYFETFVTPGICPSCGSGDHQCIFDCLSPGADCRFCTSVNQADGLGADCDLFDDSIANASCP